MECQIRNLKQDGLQYRWDVVELDAVTGETKATHYRTNQNGEGIYRIDRREDKQIAGNCQFRPSNKIGSARRQIQRFFSS